MGTMLRAHNVHDSATALANAAVAHLVSPAHAPSLQQTAFVQAAACLPDYFPRHPPSSAVSNRLLALPTIALSPATFFAHHLSLPTAFVCPSLHNHVWSSIGHSARPYRGFVATERSQHVATPAHSLRIAIVIFIRVLQNRQRV